MLDTPRTRRRRGRFAGRMLTFLVETLAEIVLAAADVWDAVTRRVAEVRGDVAEPRKSERRDPRRGGRR